MSTEEDYRLREIQREYLDFLDDDVGTSVFLVLLWKLNAWVSLNGSLESVGLQTQGQQGHTWPRPNPYPDHKRNPNPKALTLS